MEDKRALLYPSKSFLLCLRSVARERKKKEEAETEGIRKKRGGRGEKEEEIRRRGEKMETL
jgi:hypothetical protein